MPSTETPAAGYLVNYRYHLPSRFPDCKTDCYDRIERVKYQEWTVFPDHDAAYRHVMTKGLEDVREDPLLEEVHIVRLPDFRFVSVFHRTQWLSSDEVTLDVR